MSWSLEADLDLEPARGLALVRALAGFFAADLERCKVIVTRGDRADRVASHDLEDLAELGPLLAVPADHAVEVRLLLRGAGALDYRPQPEVTLFGADLAGMGQSRRRAPAMIAFGERAAWREPLTLPSGLSLSPDTVAAALEHVCRTVRPASLYLGSEPQVSLPVNDHFVYHDDRDGFLRDLEDLAQLALRGGAPRYRDARARYRPALAETGAPMLAGRHPEHAAVLRRFLAAQLPRLEARGLPAQLALPTAEHAVLAADDLHFFFTERGLGLHYKPLLAGYVESFYLALIEQLA